MLSQPTSGETSSAAPKRARVLRSNNVMAQSPKVLGEIVHPMLLGVSHSPKRTKHSARFVRPRSRKRNQECPMATTKRRRRSAARTSGGEIPRRPFGNSSELVSALALGGYHLGLVGNQREAIRIV